MLPAGGIRVSIHINLQQEVASGGGIPVSAGRTEAEQRRKLEASGWRMKEKEDSARVWEDPISGRLFRREAAYFLLVRRERKELT